MSTTQAPASEQRSAGAPRAHSPRDPLLRLGDFYEISGSPDPKHVHDEAERCMNCGAAFCQPSSGYGAGCPIDNKIPEWNELVRLGRWRDAYARLSLTNNFPEFTARICPAPCQDACIHAINEEPIAIKSIERAIIDRAFEEGWVVPESPQTRTGRRVAVIGSGPAGLTTADQLNRAGHAVTVYERSDRPGGLLTYGIPNMKLEKTLVERRIGLLEASGIGFVCDAAVGVSVDPQELAATHDAVLVAVGALEARELALPGRDLPGVCRAMDYLEGATRAITDGSPAAIDARDKDVVVIGGGDTGADCIATALRQGCRSLVNITRREQPPDERCEDHPWPGPPCTYQVDYAHAEGRARFGRDPRTFRLEPVAFLPETTSERGDGRVAGLRVRDRSSGTTSDMPAQLIVLAIGFTGHAAPTLADRLGFVGSRGRLSPTPERPGDGPVTFACGDCVTGPSLVVTAIAEGRRSADQIDRALRTT